VRKILINPKYTGYMVWNRRATKKGGRNNPPSAWVWSDQPTHEPLVDRGTFEAAAQVAKIRRGSRTEPGPNSAHHEARHGYLLRSYVRCGLCEQRMFGKTRHGRPYYMCYPAGNNADRLDRYPAEHPKTVYVREDALVAALDHVIATRVFGPDRHTHLQRGLAGLPDKRQRAEHRRAEVLREQIADIEARQDRLVAELEMTDAGDRVFRDRLRRRFDALEAERADMATQLFELEAAAKVEPRRDVALLDAVPILAGINITQAPEPIQRRLYDALQLQIHYDRPDRARFRLVLTDDAVGALAASTVTNVGTTDRTGIQPGPVTSANVTTLTPRQRAHEPGALPGAPPLSSANTPSDQAIRGERSGPDVRLSRVISGSRRPFT
jgi:hypothetical protein